MRKWAGLFSVGGASANDLSRYLLRRIGVRVKRRPHRSLPKGYVRVCPGFTRGMTENEQSQVFHGHLQPSWLRLGRPHPGVLFLSRGITVSDLFPS